MANPWKPEDQLVWYMQEEKQTKKTTTTKKKKPRDPASKEVEGKDRHLRLPFDLHMNGIIHELT